jgi:hypothetical protein
MRVHLFALSALFAAACAGQAIGTDPGQSAASTSTSKTSASSSSTTSLLPSVPSQGGPTLGALDLVTVTYAGFPFNAEIDAFGDYVVGSEWLTTVGAEYGIENGTHEHVELLALPPLTLDPTSAGALLAKQIEAGTLPKPGAHTVYMYYAAPTTIMSDDDPSDSCASFDGTYSPGYHYEGTAGGKRFAFGVVPTCAALLPSTLEMVTAHELIEAATDPYLVSAPGYIFPENSAWWQTGGEVADICDAPTVADGHTLTRVWSNRAAAAGANPCLPEDTAYMSVKALAPITLPLGSTKAFPLAGWSVGTSPSWWVYAMPGVYGGPSLSPDLDVAQLDDDAVTHLQLTAPADAKHGDTVQVLVYSEAQDQATRFVAPISVTYE